MTLLHHQTMAAQHVLLYLATLLVLCLGLGLVEAVIPRREWGARKPRQTTPLHVPVPLVFIHHTATRNCDNFKHCAALVRSIQNYHMDTRGWSDIGYNFLVGGSGLVFKGRGWHTVGAQTKGYNSRSVGISLMGNYNLLQPLDSDLSAIIDLIKDGVMKGFISPDYKLFGHRQAYHTTECPGDKLYAKIQTWPHYSKYVPPPGMNALGEQRFKGADKVYGRKKIRQTMW